jgi:polysaccharide export outer membrane protein
MRQPCLFVRYAAVGLAALAVAGCARRSAPVYTMIDPATGQQVQVMAPPNQPPGQTAYAQAPVYAPPSYSAPQNFSLTQTYIPPQPPVYAAPPPQQSSGRGLFNSRRTTTYAQPQLQQPYVVQYGAGQPYVAPRAAAPVGGPYQAAPQAAPYGAYASAPAAYEPSYSLDSGDRLRIVVFGQEGISNSYLVDAGGNVNLPLIGTVPARGTSPQQLARIITDKLKQGYVREPHVTVEVEAYRPFFILGEVTNPGQFPYVANMTAETAIAIAGGFAPRASKSKVELTRNSGGQQFHGDVPLNYPLRPGDTIVVKERWF